ncbi:MAG TPA: hypothetical protein PKK13_12225 [Spirochaetota bacterium]|nr:hypothetical protein [Spirochaetota bacterium]
MARYWVSPYERSIWKRYYYDHNSSDYYYVDYYDHNSSDHDDYGRGNYEFDSIR